MLCYPIQVLKNCALQLYTLLLCELTVNVIFFYREAVELQYAKGLTALANDAHATNEEG